MTTEDERRVMDAEASFLYLAWCRGDKPSVTITREWADLPFAEQLCWRAVAEQARKVFAPENNQAVDDLMREIERIHATVRDTVSARTWERIQYRLNNLSPVDEKGPIRDELAHFQTRLDALQAEIALLRRRL